MDASYILPVLGWKERCLGEPPDASPGIYGCNTHAEAGKWGYARGGLQGSKFGFPSGSEFYIGRSQNIKTHLVAHHSPVVVRVNSIVCAAKAITTLTDWMSGSLVTLDGNFSHVPISVWSAVETSLIACHGSTTSTGKAKINIVVGQVPLQQRFGEAVRGSSPKIPPYYRLPQVC